MRALLTHDPDASLSLNAQEPITIVSFNLRYNYSGWTNLAF